MATFEVARVAAITKDFTVHADAVHKLWGFDPQLRTDIDHWSEHAKYWAVVTKRRPEFAISVSAPEAETLLGLTSAMMEAGKVDPGAVAHILDQASMLSFKMISALPGDPTIDPPKPRRKRQLRTLQER